MKIKPLADRIVVAPEEAEEKTASGIILPDTAKEKPQIGKIVAVGSGRVTDSGDTIKMSLKVGDRILYGKYSGSEITVDDQDVMIMKESDVLAIL